MVLSLTRPMLLLPFRRAVVAQVFFIRDGMKFPDMVHAFKPNPKNHQQEAWRIMDFLSHHPESCHMVRGAGARGLTMASGIRLSMPAGRGRFVRVHGAVPWRQCAVAFGRVWVIYRYESLRVWNAL